MLNCFCGSKRSLQRHDVQIVAQAVSKFGSQEFVEELQKLLTSTESVRTMIELLNLIKPQSYLPTTASTAALPEEKEGKSSVSEKPSWNTIIDGLVANIVASHLYYMRSVDDMLAMSKFVIANYSSDQQVW